MKDKIYVLHIVGRMDRGGTETLLMSLLRHVDRDKYQFDFVEQTNDKCDYDDDIESLGSKIFRCPHISLFSLGKYSKWWRTFLKEHPEYKIIHGHSRGSAPIYIREAKKQKRITILHCHNNSFGKGISGLTRFIWQLQLKNLADYNFACSYDSGISQFGDNKFEVIKNGIEVSKFKWSPEKRDEIRKQYNLENGFVIGNVARFEKQKNHLFLIEVFSEIKKRIPSCTLMLIGRGSKEAEIRKRADELGVLDSVLFMGLRSDVNEFYQAMDAFVLPSLFEGLGIVNIEAQTSGLPCFVSDTVAPEAAVTNRITYISLEKSPSEWADVIVEGAIGSPKERCDMSEEITSAGFNIEETAMTLCSFYDEVLSDE